MDVVPDRVVEVPVDVVLGALVEVLVAVVSGGLVVVAADPAPRVVVVSVDVAAGPTGEFDQAGRDLAGARSRGLVREDIDRVARRALATCPTPVNGADREMALSPLLRRMR